MTTHIAKPAVQTIAHLSDIVINWHMTEACNYRCQYCYSTWKKCNRELVHNLPASVEMLAEIYRFFSPENLNNPLRKTLSWNHVRLNFAGGEPLLYADKLLQMMQAAQAMGFKLSIITNASLLTPDLAKSLAPFISILGISLDSNHAESNRIIGRQDRKGQQLDPQQLVEVCQIVKSLNPSVEIKLNTVVNAVNCHEDMSDLIQQLSPNRWKVLRMLPVVNNNLEVSEADYLGFIKRHQSLQAIMNIENNEKMAQSYLMIDPYGRFFQNELGSKDYHYSLPILQVGMEKAFETSLIKPEKFAIRYLKPLSV